jgi:hypothetical protein
LTGPSIEVPHGGGFSSAAFFAVFVFPGFTILLSSVYCASG